MFTWYKITLCFILFTYYIHYSVVTYLLTDTVTPNLTSSTHCLYGLTPHSGPSPSNPSELCPTIYSSVFRLSILVRLEYSVFIPFDLRSVTSLVSDE